MAREGMMMANWMDGVKVGEVGTGVDYAVGVEVEGEIGVEVEGEVVSLRKKNVKVVLRLLIRPKNFAQITRNVSCEVSAFRGTRTSWRCRGSTREVVYSDEESFDEGGELGRDTAAEVFVHPK